MNAEELKSIVDDVILHHKEVKITPRDLLDAFNAYRRTSGNTRIIDEYLRSHNLQTIPNYNDVWWLDESVILKEIETRPVETEKKHAKELTPNERVNQIIDKSDSLKKKLVKIPKLNADLSDLEVIADKLHGVPELLLNDDITDKIKNILNYRLVAIESALNIIKIYIKQTPTNKSRIRGALRDIKENINAIRFTIRTFNKLGYLNENLVAIGANGSGKTSLAENIKRYVKTNCVVIGAQKLLLVPKLNSVLDVEYSKKQLRDQQDKDKALKQPLIYDQDDSVFKNSIADDVADEFSAVINNLLATHNAQIHKFANDYAGDNTTLREKTILETVFDLWHKIMPQRELTCSDGINIMVTADDKSEYPAYQLSDGEKVTLYLIADVMQTPADSYIIVDEPETYLHKSIVNKLWDLLENERRKDRCVFVYLTHNIEFAVSRHAKKIWIKSYNTKEDLGWDIKEIPDNDIPPELFFEILGSRRPILFCEGVKEKDKTCSDAQIYEVLYPQFTIKPVSSCKDVINYTKAFNAIPNNSCKAYGIIDADFRTVDQLKKLSEANIYALTVSEVENLFLSEAFLKGMAEWLHRDPDAVFSEVEMAIKKTFKENIEIQVSQYVSAKIDYFFKEEHFRQANQKSELTNHFSDFCSKISIPAWITERENDLAAISDNYGEIIKVYNNKGLKAHVNGPMDVHDFPARAFEYLRECEEPKEVLRRMLPKELSEVP